MIWIVLLAVVLAVAALAWWPVRVHNRLVAWQTTVVESWRGVDVELARRWALIPRLVAIARAYAKHEAQTLADLVTRRARGDAAGTSADVLAQLHDHVLDDQVRQDVELSAALERVRATAEDYPELRSSSHYLDVMTALSDTENRIAAARRLYNGNVSRYNAALRTFPATLLARRAGLTPADFFEVDDRQRGVPGWDRPLAE